METLVAAEQREVPVVVEEERVTPFNDEELAHFEQIIQDKRRDTLEDIERMRLQLEDSRNHVGDNREDASGHYADHGTDVMGREQLYLLLARQQKYIGYLDRALDRIRNKTYGICKVTGRPIAKQRLESVPHTELSIEVKLKQKK